ncbi:MAG TPA: hypothetical protein VLK35_16420 [Methylomirabilota bacterium]|nr:hypothetical protein [Methylomirabilota bacterium]
MDDLVTIVCNLITETNGAREAVWAAMREHIRTDPAILLDAWDGVTDLGSEAGPHGKEQLTQAQQLVNDVLHAIGDAAGHRWRDVNPVARGLVVLVAREIAAYKQGRQAAARIPSHPWVGRQRQRPGPGR